MINNEDLSSSDPTSVIPNCIEVMRLKSHLEFSQLKTKV